MSAQYMLLVMRHNIHARDDYVPCTSDYVGFFKKRNLLQMSAKLITCVAFNFNVQSFVWPMYRNGPARTGNDIKI